MRAGSRWGAPVQPDLAFLPVADDVAVQGRRPGHPALQKGEVHPGNRRVTPPRKSDLASDCWPSANIDRWLAT